MEEYKYKLDAKLVSIASGTAAGLQEPEFHPDESYDEIIGVECYEVSNGGVTNGYYQLGLADEEKAYVELAHKNALLTTSSVDQRGKTRLVNIPIRKGKAIKTRVKWPTGALASDLQVEFVFVLRKLVTKTK